MADKQAMLFSDCRMASEAVGAERQNLKSTISNPQSEIPNPKWARTRRRLRKWSRDKAGKRCLSLQYQVISLFVQQGFIMSREILHHSDDHWRASAKQRIRDCVKFGLRIHCDDLGDRCIWRIDPNSRERARRLVARAR